MKKVFFGTVFILIFLIGCSSNQEIKEEINNLNQKNTKNKADIANLTARLDYVEENLNQPMGNSILEEKIQDIELKIRNIEDALRQMNETPVQIEETPVIEEVDIPDQQLSSAEIDIQYQQGLLLFDSRLYQDAINVFNELITFELEKQLEDNVHFWLGECYFSVGSNSLALEQYQIVIDKFGKHSNKYYDSLFKKATIYANMNRREEAREILRLILNETNADYYNFNRVKSYLNKIK